MTDIQPQKKILIIEDNADLSKLLSTQLENTTTAVHIAHDGEEGLKQIRSMKPDIIILDLALPRMHGYEMLKLLYKETPELETPVIVLSNTADIDMIAELKRMKTITFLPKADQDFHSIVRTILEKLPSL